MRPHGGRAATTKPVSADYDSDDGRIIELKQQGYSDGAVSQKLLQENRVRYLPKTVASRYLRLRKVLEEAEDNRLDDELSDWHVGEVSHPSGPLSSISLIGSRMTSSKSLSMLLMRSSRARSRGCVTRSGRRSRSTLRAAWIRRSTRAKPVKSASKRCKTAPPLNRSS